METVLAVPAKWGSRLRGNDGFPLVRDRRYLSQPRRRKYQNGAIADESISAHAHG
jgi:hypothetical protein